MTAMPAIAVKSASVEIEEYFARSGSRFSNRDAKIIGPELARLGQIGYSTASDILEAARPDNSPLHPYIEWEDSEAAERYREWQARQMGNSIMARIIDERGEKYETRAFHAVNVVHEEPEETAPALKSYVSVTVIRSDELLTKQVIRDALQQLIGWRKRYGQYQEIFGAVYEAIDSLQLEMEEIG